MKRFFTNVFPACLAIAVLFLASATPSEAALEVRLTASGAAIPITIVDGGAGDTDGLVNDVIITGPLTIGDIDLTSDSIFATPSALLPGAPPALDLTFNISSTGGGTLKVEMVKDGLAALAAGPLNFQIAANTLTGSGTISAVGYIDTADTGNFSTGADYHAPLLAFSSASSLNFQGHYLHGVLPTYSLGYSLLFNLAPNTFLTTGDASLDLNGDPKGPLLPEPASIAVWSVLSVLGLGFGRRLRKRAA
jgi:hypothetical protein